MLDILKKSDIEIFKDRDLDLLIESYSNSARTIQVRGITNNAQIIADHVTNADRSLATSTIDITSIPITLTVKASTTGVKRGECYVKVSLRLEGVVIAILGASYVTDTATIQWPGGKIESSIEGQGLIRSIAGTNPAVGVEITETVPVGARWKLISMEATLVNDATVANRLTSIILDDGTNIYSTSQSNTVQTANQTLLYTFLKTGAAGQQLNTTTTIPLPLEVILLAGHRIKTLTNAFQAGDNWGAPQLLVEEWISP